MVSCREGLMQLLVLCCLICFSQSLESQCSKFPYEEALLEKMVRMEFKVEQMQDGMKAIERKVLDELANIRKERRKIKSLSESAVKGVMDKYEELGADVLKEKLRLNEEKLSEMSANLETLQSRPANKGTEETTNIMFVAKDVAKSNPVNGKTMVFSTLLENKGRGYDKETGIFIAPRAGIYLFTVQFCGYPNKEFTFAFVQDETEKQPVLVNNSEYSCWTSTFLAVMDAKSRVWIKCTKSRSGNIFYSNGYRWNVFSGVLINQRLQ